MSASVGNDKQSKLLLEAPCLICDPLWQKEAKIANDKAAEIT